MFSVLLEERAISCNRTSTEVLLLEVGFQAVGFQAVGFLENLVLICLERVGFCLDFFTRIVKLNGEARSMYSIPPAQLTCLKMLLHMKCSDICAFLAL